MALPSPRYRRQFRPIGIAILLVISIYWLFWSGSDYDGQHVTNAHHQTTQTEQQPLSPPANAGLSTPSKAGKNTKELIIAKVKADDTKWLFTYFPDWKKNQYVVDDHKAFLQVPENKGREGMVYLTYIIDNYDDLPDYMLFIHPQRFQWHNDDPYYDGKNVLQNFQLPYLKEQGYVNLRCVWSLGCPPELHPFVDKVREDIHAGAYYMKAFQLLFPGEEVPEEIGVSCCAQFGLTRWKALERPKSDYERFRNWLLQTDLSDDYSGRVLEYSWHMIFGKPPIHCPSVKDCYCRVFGLCNLNCPEPNDCRDRYALPPFSNLPEGWPHIGWDGLPQDPAKGGLPRVPESDDT